MVPVFVVLTILAFVAVDAWRERHRRPAILPIAGPMPIDLSLPAGLFLHPAHTWVGILPSGDVEIGADKFLTSAIGSPYEIYGAEPGERVTEGTPIARIRTQGRELPLVSPISGTVQQVNQDVRGDWTCVISPSRLGHEIGKLMIAERAGDWLESEARRLASWLVSRTTPVASLPDGGHPVQGCVGSLDSHDLGEFANGFLTGVRDLTVERR